MRASKALKSVGKAEGQILRFILDGGPISVGEVAKHFSETQGLARTTVLTVMERLRKKGFLVRKERHGIFEYSSKLSKETWLQQQVAEFVESTLGGFASPLISYLTDAKISAQEAEDLEKLVQGLTAKSQESQP